MEGPLIVAALVLVSGLVGWRLLSTEEPAPTPALPFEVVPPSPAPVEPVAVAAPPVREPAREPIKQPVPTPVVKTTPTRKPQNTSVANPMMAPPLVVAEPIAEKAPGIVNLNCTPIACSIDIDGKPAGETPKLNLKLSEGEHDVRFVNLETGAVLMRRFEVKSGEKTTVGQRW